MDRVDCVIIGAGIVGLAIARALAIQGVEVVVLEGSPWIGAETSSRNNEVIHAGFLYPKGSLKGRLCLPGRDALYEYCDQRGIDYRRVGKLVIAVDENDVKALHSLEEQARAYGMSEVSWLDSRMAAELEPALHCAAALMSPSTGIIDSHALMTSLRGDIENAGGLVIVQCHAVSGEIVDHGFIVETIDVSRERYSLTCPWLINAAGLGAQDFALALQGLNHSLVPRLYFCKGTFFYAKGTHFRQVIVPLGSTLEQGGAFTLELGGQGKFGADFEWVSRANYAVDSERAGRAAKAVRRYYPALRDEMLYPGYAGIRPRLSGPDSPSSDWSIQGPRHHGIPGLVQLFGIDTPGLTACLAIADYVFGLLEERFTSDDPSLSQ